MKFYTKIVWIFGLVLFADMTRADEAPGLEVVTEELPPYNMTEKGRVTGLSTDVVKALMLQAGVSANSQVVRWARAYDRAQRVDLFNRQDLRTREIIPVD
ncbi:hypothetical protein [Pseudomonas sp. NPDC007930]|uniref:hypothetical protein n=1 Tax=Pseudomonas sp. NPDC007930 TaxID=3364417 RepID=UPI0036E9D56A